MCIIAVKPRGVALPSIETLKRLFYKNPDGAGIAYAIDGAITLSKGYMDINEYIKAVQKIPVEASAIIHTRISTSGGINKELTHPYILTNNYKELRRTSAKLTEGFVVAHNGVFGEFGALKGANDTMQFIVNYLHPLKELKEKARASILDADIKPLINKLVSGSRLVILNTAGEFELFGNYWHEADGVYYSNEGYKPAPAYSGYYSSKYNKYNNYDYYNDCDGFCDYCKHNFKCVWYNQYTQPEPAQPKAKAEHKSASK